MSNLGLIFYPPTIYFNDINFNNDFYATPNNNQGISLAYANTHFLFSTGVANSTATSTFFSGSVGVGAIATGLAGDMNALTYLLNGNNISNIFVSSNVLSNTSNTLNTKIDTKENILTFNTPFSRVNNSLSLSYDASLILDGTGKLSVASGNSSKWTTSGNNIFNNNVGNIGIGSQIPAYKLDVSGDINANRYLLNENNISNIFVASNVLSNTSNTIHFNYSNLNSNTSNTIHFNYSNLNSNTSNTIHFNYSNLNSNTSNTIHFDYSNLNSNTSNLLNSNISNLLFSSNSNIYATSNAVKYIVRNEMPDVAKRNAFFVSIPTTAIYYDGTSATTYYKYDLDLREYTATGTIAYTTDLMRIFKIRFWYVPSYFQSYINGEPFVNSYEVYMSYKDNPVFGRPETAGLNIYSVGFPQNEKLANILPNQLMLLRNVSGSLNYLTIVSRTAPVDIYVIIEDMLY